MGKMSFRGYITTEVKDKDSDRLLNREKEIWSQNYATMTLCYSWFVVKQKFIGNFEVNIRNSMNGLGQFRLSLNLLLL